MDETGLEGRYKFESPDKPEELTESLRQQIGFSLSSEKRPVEMPVIESMELPSFRVSLQDDEFRQKIGGISD